MKTKKIMNVNTANMPPGLIFEVIETWQLKEDSDPIHKVNYYGEIWHIGKGHYISLDGLSEEEIQKLKRLVEKGAFS